MALPEGSKRLFLRLFVVACDFHEALHGEILGENPRLLVIEIQPDALGVGVGTDVHFVLDAILDVLFVSKEGCELFHILSCLLVLVELCEHAEAVASKDVAYGCVSFFVDVYVTDAVLVVPSNHNLTF